MSTHIYCVYLTTYLGDKLPPKFNPEDEPPKYYIGSTSINKIEQGYRGSVGSKLYKNIWKNELKNYPDLFMIEIISTHSDRQEATKAELQLQQKLNSKRSPHYVNLADAKADGFIGISIKGEGNPNYGLKRSKETREKMGVNQLGKNKHNDENYRRRGETQKANNLADPSRKQKRSLIMKQRIADDNSSIMQGAAKRRGRTKSNDEGYKKVAEKHNKLTFDQRTEVLEMRDNKISFRKIHAYITSTYNIDISYTGICKLYVREKEDRN